jgi:RND family efflux transporter MFP subunit
MIRASLAALLGCACACSVPVASAQGAPSAAGSSPVGCVIEPAASADVAAPVPGVLESVLVERGTVVRRGQPIATLHAEVERAAAEAARARADADGELSALAAARDLARTKMKRMHALAELQAGARLELETAVAEFEIADHRLHQAREAQRIAQREHELARRQLGLRTIRSPIDGVVADRLLNPGERVDARPIVRLVGIDRLRVEVVVPAARFGRIREGTLATVRAELPDAPESSGRVVQVDRFVDPASGTFRALIELPNPDRRVPAGVRCQVAFDVPGPAAPRPAAHRAAPEPAAAPATAPAMAPARPAAPTPAGAAERGLPRS